MKVTDPVCQSYGVAKVCIVEKVIMFYANPLSSSAFFPDRKWTKIPVYKNLSGYNRSRHFLTFPADFFIPIIFSNLNSNCSFIKKIWEISRNKLKKNSVLKIGLTFHSLNKLISKKIQILGLQFFSITRTIWKQNTISLMIFYYSTYFSKI
jgi:hypothetical protein